MMDIVTSGEAVSISIIRDCNNLSNFINCLSNPITLFTPRNILIFIVVAIIIYKEYQERKNRTSNNSPENK